MRSKFNNIIEKFLFYIPFITFILYTNVHSFFAMRSNSSLISVLINIFNKLYMKGPYIFLGIALLLTIYVLINGSKKQKLITLATVIGCILMGLNYFRNIETSFLTALLFISSYLMGILYTLSIFIYMKNKSVDDIQTKIIKGIKTIVIYLGVMFLLAIISNTSQYSYNSAEKGLTGWIRSTNALGHSLVFLLPLFILLYIKDRKNNYLFYIIVIIILDLLVGTKACYFGLLSTLFISLLYLFINFSKKGKYNNFKLLSLVLVLVILFSSNLLVNNNIKQSIDYNISEQGKFDIFNFITNNRIDNVKIIKPYFNDQDTFTKVFGIGLYYPRFDFIYVEFDLFDILYSRGIYGLILNVTFYGIIIINLFKKVFKNIKNKFNVEHLFIFLTLGYIIFTSLFIGHVAFNLMPLTVAIVIMFYYFLMIDKKDEIKKLKQKNN